MAILRFATRKEFTPYLADHCCSPWAEVPRSRPETTGKRLERDRVAISDLPVAPFKACDQPAGAGAPQDQGLPGSGYP